jgi:hypothetical protein
MRIVESEGSRNLKEGISVAKAIQGAKDLKLGFELDRAFAHSMTCLKGTGQPESMDTEAN